MRKLSDVGLWVVDTAAVPYLRKTSTIVLNLISEHITVQQAVSLPRHRVTRMDLASVGRARGEIVDGSGRQAWSEYWAQRIVAQKEQLREAARLCHLRGIQLVVMVPDESDAVSDYAFSFPNCALLTTEK